jgi:hypothetical protein
VLCPWWRSTQSCPTTTAWTSSARRFITCTTNRPTKFRIHQQHYKLLLTCHSRMLESDRLIVAPHDIFSAASYLISALLMPMILCHNNLILFHIGKKVNWRGIVPKIKLMQIYYWIKAQYSNVACIQQMYKYTLLLLSVQRSLVLAETKHHFFWIKDRPTKS